jgi:hypothetical protein
MINLSEVTIDYKEVIPKHIQSPEFYVEGNGSNTIAILSRGDREIYVSANGEMDLTIPNIVDGELSDEGATRIRYASDLFEAGIKDDIQFIQLIKTISNAGFEIYRMNPWWEIWAEHDPDGIVSDSDNFYDAIDIATALLFDEEYWGLLDED